MNGLTGRGIGALAGMAVLAVAMAACGHHNAHPKASAAASSAKAAAYQDITSPKVLAAEKKLAPKVQTCLKTEGATVTFTGAGTKNIKVTPGYIHLHFITRTVRHPVVAFETLGTCAGLTKTQIKALEHQTGVIIAANGIGKGSFGTDVQQWINAAAVEVSK